MSIAKVLFLIFTVPTLYLLSFSSPQFNRTKYYLILKNNDLKDMELYTKSIENINYLKPYLGTMYMKMAGLQKKAIQKIKTFSLGKKMLESTIKNNPKNVEWRFLRFMTQENAPKLMKYNTKLIEDKQIIINNFTSCDKKLQEIIKSYANKSHLLNPNDLKNKY